MNNLTPFTGETLVPHDITAERAILGSLMQSDEAIRDVAFLAPADFYIVRHAWLFEAMQAIGASGRLIDPVTVSAELEKRGRLAEIGGMGEIALLLAETVSAVGVDAYAHIVHDHATRRRLLEAAQHAARLAYANDSDLDDILAQSQAAMAEVADHHIGSREIESDAYTTAGEVIDAVNDWNLHPTDIRGMETGLTPLDVAVSGIESETLTYLAGRPGSGKSALLDQMACGLAENGHPVLLFSLEMSKRAVMLRMACQKAHVNSDSARKGKLTPVEHGELVRALGKISELPIDVLPLTGPTMAEIKTRARQYVRRRGTEVVMIDTINRAQPSSKANSAYERMTMKSNESADLAHDEKLKIAVVCAVQMSRASEQRSNKQPELSDLRDSGELEQDADGVWGLYRPGYYEPENLEVAHLAELHILKHREGEAGGLIQLFWEPTWPGFARLKKTTTNTEFRNSNQTPFVDGRHDPIERQTWRDPMEAK